MKKLTMIAALLLFSANTNANASKILPLSAAIIGVAAMVVTEPDETLETIKAIHLTSSAKVSLGLENLNTNVHLRSSLGYIVPLNKEVDLGVAYSVVSNGDTRSDLYFNIKYSSNLNLMMGPSMNTTDSGRSLGGTLGYELDVGKDSYMSTSVNFDVDNRTVTSAYGIRF